MISKAPVMHVATDGRFSMHVHRRIKPSAWLEASFSFSGMFDLVFHPSRVSSVPLSAFRKSSSREPTRSRPSQSSTNMYMTTARRAYNKPVNSL